MGWPSSVSPIGETLELLICGKAKHKHPFEGSESRCLQPRTKVYLTQCGIVQKRM